MRVRVRVWVRVRVRVRVWVRAGLSARLLVHAVQASVLRGVVEEDDGGDGAGQLARVLTRVDQHLVVADLAVGVVLRVGGPVVPALWLELG